MGYLNVVGHVPQVLEQIPGILAHCPEIHCLNLQGWISKLPPGPIQLQRRPHIVQPIIHNSLADGQGNGFVQQLFPLFHRLLLLRWE